jgi:hypothetical protein
MVSLRYSCRLASKEIVENEMVMSFKNFTDDHSQGTYANVKLSDTSKRDLVKFLESRGIEHDDPDGFHCTIIYSKTPCPDCKHYIFDLPIHAEFKSWELFTTRDGGKCLVMKIASPEIERMHHDIRQVYGASHDYPEFKPHVTICYAYNKDEKPSPVMGKLYLTFDVAEVKALDQSFSPKKKDQ